MKTLFSMLSFPPSNFGGIPLSMEPLITRLSKECPSLEAYVLTSDFGVSEDYKVEKDKFIIKDGYRVKYVNSNQVNFPIKFITNGLTIINEVDKIHLSSVFFFPNLILAYYSLFLGKKVFWSPHGELLKSAFQSKIWKKAPYFILVLIISPWITIRVTSHQEENRLRRILPFSKIKVIPNIITYKERVITQKKAQFLFLGRIARIKQINNIIRACRNSIKFIECDYKFIIAGPKDDASRGYYEEIVCSIKSNGLQGKVIFYGSVHSPQKEALIAESKALFLVSKSENFGNVVVEALQQGTPVVASKGTPWESLNEKKCGLWIENSPKELSKAIDYFIEMDELRYQEMCSNALDYSNQFQGENIVQSWIQLLND